MFILNYLLLVTFKKKIVSGFFGILIPGPPKLDRVLKVAYSEKFKLNQNKYLKHFYLKKIIYIASSISPFHLQYEMEWFLGHKRSLMAPLCLSEIIKLNVYLKLFGFSQISIYSFHITPSFF